MMWSYLETLRYIALSMTMPSIGLSTGIKIHYVEFYEQEFWHCPTKDIDKFQDITEVLPILEGAWVRFPIRGLSSLQKLTFKLPIFNNCGVHISVGKIIYWVGNFRAMGRLNLLGGQINLLGGLTCHLPPWSKHKSPLNRTPPPAVATVILRYMKPTYSESGGIWMCAVVNIYQNVDYKFSNY